MISNINSHILVGCIPTKNASTAIKKVREIYGVNIEPETPALGWVGLYVREKCPKKERVGIVNFLEGFVEGLIEKTGKNHE
jgi:hypothetical protein